MSPDFSRQSAYSDRGRFAPLLPALPDDVVQQISELETRHRFNSVVDAGEPGFLEVPQGS